MVVSLARQKHLSPALVSAARDLLQTKLNSCNGQDVSQILFGLMLDKHSVPDAAETFRVIAPALAQHLRSDETFQVRNSCSGSPLSCNQAIMAPVHPVRLFLPTPFHEVTQN